MGIGNGINYFQEERQVFQTLEWGRPVLILLSVLYYDERRVRHSLCDPQQMAPVLIHIMYADMYTCNSKVSHFHADGTVISGSQGFKAFYDTAVPGIILNCDGDFSHLLVTTAYQKC